MPIDNYNTEGQVDKWDSISDLTKGLDTKNKEELEIMLEECEERMIRMVKEHQQELM